VVTGILKVRYEEGIRMIDQWKRNIDYLRISVTDKCNLRCTYCMPKEGLQFIPEEKLLTKEEIVRVVSAMAELGVTKVRITGGELLVRADIVDIIKGVKSIPGIKEVCITTNGILLGRYVEELVEAGLDRVNISLDTLRPEAYRSITRGGDLDKVLEAIELSIEKGLKVKLNVVIIKDFNEEDIFDLVEMSEKKPISVRFIELMPIGQGKQNKGLTSEEIKEYIQSRKVLIPCESSSSQGGPANYFRTESGRGTIGFISPMSHSFCDSCNRIRVTAEGFLKLCLHWKHGTDLREPLRNGITDEELKEIIAEGIFNKPQAHKFKDNSMESDKRSMYEIGG
jgi:GTP 3',8-cyclase